MSPTSLDRIDPKELGSRLQAARKARGLTQEDVADRLNVSRTTVTAMEGGDRRIKAEELRTLAGLYGRRIGELVAREEPAEPFTVQLRSTFDSREFEECSLDDSIFEFQRLCEDYLNLERQAGAALEVHHPPPYKTDLDRPERSGEDIASRERQRLGLGDAPVLSLRELLETDVGLRIFYMGLPSRVAAMFAFTTELGGCIAVNRNHPPERRRHSLAHDYGHFLTDRFRPAVAVLGRYERVPARERAAEAFGRAFLLPSSGLTRRFNDLYQARSGSITPADLCTLAHFFFVSVEVLTRRLEGMDLIPSGSWARLKEKGFRVRDAQRMLDLPERYVSDRLLPLRYRYLAAELFQRGEISEGQLARYLRADRVKAREAVLQLSRSDFLTEQGDVTSESLNLGTPL